MNYFPFNIYYIPPPPPNKKAHTQKSVVGRHLVGLKSHRLFNITTLPVEWYAPLVGHAASKVPLGAIGHARLAIGVKSKRARTSACELCQGLCGTAQAQVRASAIVGTAWIFGGHLQAVVKHDESEGRMYGALT